jgi:OmpA-OmpF porin, OOP family
VKTRGLRLQPREEEARDSGGPGSVDLQIAFALQSATLLPEARRQLDELVKALKSQGLAGRSFLLAGHTDASGRAEYNRGLSLARANSVRDYLAKAGVDTAHLAVAGFGADHPLPGRSPYDAANRRVEVRAGEGEP